MSTPFDSLKAQREVVAGTLVAHKAFRDHASDCERRIAEIEAQHRSALLMERLCQEMIEVECRKLRALEESAT